MDYGVKVKRKENPREKSNILQTLLFTFTFDTIRKGVRSDLKEKDIYASMKKYKSDSLGDRLEVVWKEELKKPKPRLLLCFFKMFGLEYIILGTAIFFYETSVLMLRPTFSGKLVSYFEPHTTVTRNEAILYGVGLLCCSFTLSLFNPTYLMVLEQICLKIRIAVCSVLYRKCLKLNLVNSSEFASGTAVILMTKDVARFEAALDHIHMMSAGIFQLMILTYLMYREIGVASLIGTSILFIMVPILVCLGKRVESYRLKTSENTDERIKVTQEILTAIRIIKMYTWEIFFSKSVKELRNKEIKNLRIIYYLKAIIACIGQLSSRVAFYICVMSYILLGNHITAEKAFIVIGCFTGLETALTGYLPAGIPFLAELEASLTRLRDFLLLDEVTPDHGLIKMYNKNPRIVFENVTVKIHKTEILKNINGEIQQGLTILTGNVGSGKSTFLKIILGDLKKETGAVTISGEVSYASQDPWLFPSTVRQNIIFGEEFDQKRYEEIVEVCALKRDFSAFADGDQTLVSDKGLNLSRGQKTRINLARAIYKKADIYLLDDCLSAVDAHVGKHIFYECVKGFLVDKICILVTHQKDLLDEADEIVLLSEGSIKFKGSYLNLQKWDNTFKLLSSIQDVKPKMKYLREDSQLECVSEKTNKKNSLVANGSNLSNNVYKETKEEGAVKMEVYTKYFTYGGGILMLTFVVFISLITQIASSWSDYFISYWVELEQDLSGFRYNHTTNSLQYRKLTESYSTLMIQYSLVILAATLCTVLRSIATYIFASKASVNIHKSVFGRILNAGIIFFDMNLSGNILNRLSRDLGIIDEQLPFTAFDVVKVTLTLAGTLFVVSSVNLYFIIPSIILSAVLVIARYLYMPTGRSIRRLEGSTRSPMIGHLNATLEGLTTIRVSQTQELLRKEFDEHQDLYNSVSYMQLATTRAFGLYIDVLCAVYITIITFSFIFVKTDALAGEVGLAITQSFALTGILQWGVRGWAELENQMTSAERVLEYTRIKIENKSGNKLEDWPKRGEIVYTNVNLRYSPTAEKVLRNVSFAIKPSTRIGVVGRTGAGKSSLLSVLFRLYDFEGSITIDNVDISGIEVTLLRSKISIIPQDPVLFSGTVRNNLDPDMKYEDKELWDALEEVKIKPLVESLNMNISDSGSNFSIGQRQLFCLARAVVNKNNILVLDEATANVDPYTDDLIQRTIQTKFSNTTVITVAHRLPNVMDSDKILVMDNGEVIEYDQPDVLLSNRNGMFYKMVQKAGLL